MPSKKKPIKIINDLTPENLIGMRVLDLKAELKRRGLNTYGTKIELINRLSSIILPLPQIHPIRKNNGIVSNCSETKRDDAVASTTSAPSTSNGFCSNNSHIDIDENRTNEISAANECYPCTNADGGGTRADESNNYDFDEIEYEVVIETETECDEYSTEPNTITNEQSTVFKNETIDENSELIIEHNLSPTNDASLVIASETSSVQFYNQENVRCEPVLMKINENFDEIIETENLNDLQTVSKKETIVENSQQIIEPPNLSSINSDEKFHEIIQTETENIERSIISKNEIIVEISKLISEELNLSPTNDDKDNASIIPSETISVQLTNQENDRLEPISTTETNENFDEIIESVNKERSIISEKQFIEPNLSPINNDDRNKTSIGHAETSSNQENRRREPISIAQRFRNSNRPDEDFDLDEDNFAKLDQPFDDSRVVLDPYNADLNLKINADNRLLCDPLSKEGFYFMLAGVRATHGFDRGKIGFEVKIVEIVDISELKPEEIYDHEIRVGWSTCESTLRLGESVYSYAYCNNGKKANLNIFTKIGSGYGVGDVVACLMDFDSMLATFAVNGLVVADGQDLFHIGERLKNFDSIPTLFPHICIKNVKFEVNFGRLVTPWYGLPEGYAFVDDVPFEQRLRGPTPPTRKEDCTVLCMIGLPSSGKSTWIRRFLQSSHDKQWTILSTGTVLDQMKVYGEPRKKKHQGRWDMMMGVAVKCLNRLILLACRMRKNYILDATNVYPVPRRKKMVPFKDFKKKAVVVVPTVEDYANRCLQQMRHEGKQMPSDAMLEMKACFTLPKVEDGVFDEIEFVELQGEDAQKVVDYFNEEGKSFKPREKKRRGDWQQEELPPKQPKLSTPTTTTTTTQKPYHQIGPANHSQNYSQKLNSAYPYGVSPSLRPYAPASTFTRQWTTPTVPGSTTPKANGHTQNQANNWAQMRGNVAGYTPRAGWPANWPQASWNQLNSAASQQNTPSSTSSGSQFTFPPPSTSS